MCSSFLFVHVVLKRLSFLRLTLRTTDTPPLCRAAWSIFCPTYPHPSLPRHLSRRRLGLRCPKPCRGVPLSKGRLEGGEAAGADVASNRRHELNIVVDVMDLKEQRIRQSEEEGGVISTQYRLY